MFAGIHARGEEVNRLAVFVPDCDRAVARPRQLDTHRDTLLKQLRYRGFAADACYPIVKSCEPPRQLDLRPFPERIHLASDERNAVHHNDEREGVPRRPGKKHTWADRRDMQP